MACWLEGIRDASLPNEDWVGLTGSRESLQCEWSIQIGNEFVWKEWCG